MTYLFVFLQLYGHGHGGVLPQNMDNKHLLQLCLLTIWFILLSADQPFRILVNIFTFPPNHDWQDKQTKLNLLTSSYVTNI